MNDPAKLVEEILNTVGFRPENARRFAEAYRQIREEERKAREEAACKPSKP